MRKPERNYGIELYRIFLMFGICLLHSITQGIASVQMKENLSGFLLFCVDGFIFISGYYGVNFRLSKLVCLYTTSLVSVISVVVLAEAVGVEGNGLAKDMKRCFEGLWFLHGYAIMMLLSHPINICINHLKSSGNVKEIPAIVMPIVILVFGVIFVTDIPCIERHVRTPNGVDSYSALTLLGVYVVGRVFKECGLERVFIKKGLCVCILLMLFGLAGPLGLGYYSSPVALGLAIIFFCFFKNVKIKSLCGMKSVEALCGSLFAVYCIHSNTCGFKLIRKFETILCFDRYYIILSFILTAVTLFVGCVFMDIPRRVLVMALKDKLSKFLDIIDEKYDEISKFKVKERN